MKRENTIGMVTELCTGGDLISTAPIKESKVRSILAQLLRAVHYMHKRGIYHHNLATENSTFLTAVVVLTKMKLLCCINEDGENPIAFFHHLIAFCSL
jgi:tRNA A-37 threonylcarbamoyl transferase component Bud32